ncbi:hypothetical protein [Planctopirus hydrillae]|uniref:hypothetical protein n=1 Tax=Planctopirus hydrillae TaxID=1841610 RepID=UPI000A7325EC|nr:hypothetical protein [Planctopirus hydrillae]
MTTRTVETPNPATPSASFPLVPLLKPASGNLTLTATVYRDSSDDTPTLVTVKNQTGATLGSTTLTTPPGNLTANISIPGTASETCEIEPVITVTPIAGINIACCEFPIPATLTNHVTVSGTGTSADGTHSYTLVYTEENSRVTDPGWYPPDYETEDDNGTGVTTYPCGTIFFYCYGHLLSNFSYQAICPSSSHMVGTFNVQSCNPFSATWSMSSPDGTIQVEGTIS